MKKLILILMIVMLSGFAYSQQAVAHTAAPVRFQIHKEKHMLKHEGNGMSHDFRKFHRYKHFKHMKHKRKHHRRAMRRAAH